MPKFSADKLVSYMERSGRQWSWLARVTEMTPNRVHRIKAGTTSPTADEYLAIVVALNDGEVGAFAFPFTEDQG